MKRISNLFFYTIIGLLIAIPFSYLYLGYQTTKFAEAHPETTCSFVGILFFILIVCEILLVLIFPWINAIRNKEMKLIFKIPQLAIIFLLGILPGLFFTLLVILRA